MKYIHVKAIIVLVNLSEFLSIFKKCCILTPDIYETALNLFRIN